MRDALPVRLVERVRDLDGDLERLIERERPLFQPLGQCLPVEVLHDQEVDPVLAADVMEGANVGVVQAGDGLRLALEPLLQIRVRGDMLGEDLDGDGSIESRVSRFVHFPHAARADGVDDLVRAEPLLLRPKASVRTNHLVFEGML